MWSAKGSNRSVPHRRPTTACGWSRSTTRWKLNRRMYDLPLARRGRQGRLPPSRRPTLAGPWRGWRRGATGLSLTDDWLLPARDQARRLAGKPLYHCSRSGAEAPVRWAEPLQSRASCDEGGSARLFPVSASFAYLNRHTPIRKKTTPNPNISSICKNTTQIGASILLPQCLIPSASSPAAPRAASPGCRRCAGPSRSSRSRAPSANGWRA